MRNQKSLSSMELKFVGHADDSFTEVLKRQMELHEGMTFVDLLKFLYQSSLGPFHLFEMMNETELKDWIRKNLKDAKPSDGPLTEELYGRKWVRINFGPYKMRFGNDYQRIFEAFVKAKNTRQGQLEEYKGLLKKLVEAIRKGKIRPTTGEPEILSVVNNFLNEYEKKDFPAIHHSETYIQKNSCEYLVLPYSGSDNTV